MKHKSILFLFILIVSLCFVNISVFADSDKNEDATAYLAIKAMANSDYLVTAGDIYSLNYLAGSREVNYKIVVDISYRIRVANLATINARGLTFYQLKRQVENIVVKNYPFSGVQFMILKVGSFPVYITGEVKNSSEITVNAMARLSSVVWPFLTKYSSTRDIEIISRNGSKKTYDIFLASASGKFDQDPYLRPGSTIKINRIKKLVTISGAVERPGAYQLLSGENLNELINFYGKGPTEFADTSEITVKRYIRVEGKPLGNSVLLSTKKEIDSFKLKNNDKVYVEDSAELRGLVYFEGSIKSNTNLNSDMSELDNELELDDQPEANKEEGLGNTVVPVEFLEGDDLVSVVREKRNLFSPMSDTKNAYLMRQGKKIYENFNRIFFDPDYNEKILLKPNDRIVVPYLNQTVTVLGAVLNPGSYPYVPGKTYEYYIGLAGGFDKNRNIASAVYIRDVAGNYMDKTDHILPGSTVTAKSNSFTYNFNKYVPIITTAISIITVTLTIITFINKAGGE